MRPSALVEGASHPTNLLLVFGRASRREARHRGDLAGGLSDHHELAAITNHTCSCSCQGWAATSVGRPDHVTGTGDGDGPHGG